MKMDFHDTQRLLDFYREALEKHGDRDPRSVRWTTQRDQERRFRVLTMVDELQGCSVLDVGCGLGDLYKYFLKNEIDVEYTGIDIVPEFIEVAQKKYLSADFECRDIFEVEKKYDFVLASGSLSFKVADNQTYYLDMIKRMYQQCRIATAFNMLDRKMHIDDETYAAYSPEEIADFCDGIAGHVEIVTDYLPQDFTIYLFR